MGGAVYQMKAIKPTIHKQMFRRKSTNDKTSTRSQSLSI